MNIVTRHRYLAPSSLLSAKAAVYRRPFSISTSRALFGKIGDSLEAFNEHLQETSGKEGLQYIPFEKWPRSIQSFPLFASPDRAAHFTPGGRGSLRHADKGSAMRLIEFYSMFFPPSQRGAWPISSHLVDEDKVGKWMYYLKCKLEPSDEPSVCDGIAVATKQVLSQVPQWWLEPTTGAIGDLLTESARRVLVPNYAAVRQSRPYIRVAEVHDLRVYYPFLEFCDEFTYMSRHESDAALCRWISRLPEKTFKETLKRMFSNQTSLMAGDVARIWKQKGKDPRAIDSMVSKFSPRGNGVYFYIHAKADVTLETGWYKDVETSSLVRLPTVCRILDVHLVSQLVDVMGWFKLPGEKGPGKVLKWKIAKIA